MPLCLFARPGLIIGKKGQELRILRQSCKTLGRTADQFEIVEEVGPGPSLPSSVGRRRISLNNWPSASEASRRTMKRSLEQTMDAVQRHQIFRWRGRPRWSRMASCEKQIAGSDPAQHVCQAKIDYGFTEADDATGAHRDSGFAINQGTLRRRQRWR